MPREANADKACRCCGGGTLLLLLLGMLMLLLLLHPAKHLAGDFVKEEAADFSLPDAPHNCGIDAL